MKTLITFLILLGAALAQVSGNATVAGNATYGGGYVTLPVTYDSTGHTSTTAAGTSVASGTLTIGAVTNGAVLCYASFSVDGVSGISVTVGGVSLSPIAGTDSTTGQTGNRSIMYGAATGNATGAKTLAMSWTTTASAGLDCTSHDNVNQSTPFKNGTFNTNNFASSIAVSITSATGDMTVDGVNYSANAPITSSQTNRSDFQTTDFNSHLAMSTAAGSASNTHTETPTGSTSYSQSGVDIAQLSGGTGMPSFTLASSCPSTALVGTGYTGTTATTNCGLGTETSVSQSTGLSGHVTAIYVNEPTAPSAGQSVIWTLRKNAANTAATCTVSGTSTTCSLIGLNISIATTDLLDVSDVGTGSVAASFYSVTLVVGP